jgi:uncharacterized integral membrane protein
MMPSQGRPEPKEPGFRPSGRQIVGAVIAIVLIVFIATNTDDANVTLIFFDVEWPLWLVLAVSAVLGVLVGMGIGARRTKRKYMSDD